MATSAGVRVKMATKATEKDETAELETPSADSPLLDLSDAAVKRMINTEFSRLFPAKRLDSSPATKIFTNVFGQNPDVRSF